MTPADFRALRDLLVKLYPDTPSINRIVDDSGIIRARIEFTSHSSNNWHYVLREAEHQGKINDLLEVVQNEYPNALILSRSVKNNSSDSVITNIFQDEAGEVGPLEVSIQASRGRRGCSVQLRLLFILSMFSVLLILLVTSDVTKDLIERVRRNWTILYSPTATVTPILIPALTNTPTPVPTATAAVTPTSTITSTEVVPSILTPTPPDMPTPLPGGVEPFVTNTTFPNQPSESAIISADKTTEPTNPASLTPVSTLAVATSTPTLAPTVTPTAPPASLSGRIAYSILNSRGTDIDTYVYRIVDGERYLYLANMRHPDFGGESLLLNSSPGSIIRMAIDGSNQRPITRQAEDEYPHWSVGGGSVVYGSRDTEASPRKIFLLRDVNRPDNEPLRSPNGGHIEGRYPLFLANERIVFNGCNNWAGSGSCGIYTINDNGTDAIMISELPQDIPTDNYDSDVFFMSPRNGNWDIYTSTWNGANGIQPLTDDPNQDGLATVSPDGQHIAFLTNREEIWAVYVMHRDGSAQQKLFELNGTFGADDKDWTQQRLSWGP